MAQKFVIQTDYKEVEAAVQQIEQDFAFRAVQAIKNLRLSEAEEQIVLEVARQGRCTQAQLKESLGDKLPDFDLLLAGMLAKTYLVEMPTVQPPTYVLSFYLQPPRPLSPQVAHEINTQINQNGGITSAYIHRIYDSLGEAGLELIGEVMEEQGRKYAAAMASVRGGGPQVVGRRYLELMEANGAPLECVESNPDHLTYRQRECPYKLQKGETALCDAVNRFDNAILAELGCRLRFTHRLVDGASFCQAVIETGEDK